MDVMQAPPLLERISDYVGYWARRSPGKPVFLSANGSTSYLELAKRVDAISKALIRAGVRKGDVVAMLATPRPIFMETLLATSSIGATWVGLNPRLTPTELAVIISDANPKLVLCQASFEVTHYTDTIIEAKVLAGHEGPLIVFHGVDARARDFEDFLAQGRTISDRDLETKRSEVAAGDPAVLVYTSGSTGRPKGVLLSHNTLCFVYREQIIAFGVVGGNFVASLPINHVGGIGFVGCNPLIGGGSMYFMDRFDPEAVLRLATKGDVDCILALAGMIESLVDHPLFEQTSFEHIRTVAWGGAALPPQTVARLQEKACRLATLYGMSEMPGSISVTGPTASLEELTETVGRVSSYMSLRLVDRDGNDCETGQEGEIRVKHEALFLGYHGLKDETAASFDEKGYFQTGDIGRLDELNNLRMVGRLKEMYKSGGYNIYPREIENCLGLHPSVAHAAVLAVPDAKFQEVGWAFVLPRSKASCEDLVEELAEWCAQRLANYKRPKKIFVINEFPVLHSGKVDKIKLRELHYEPNLKC